MSKDLLESYSKVYGHSPLIEPLELVSCFFCEKPVLDSHFQQHFSKCWANMPELSRNMFFKSQGLISSIDQQIFVDEMYSLNDTTKIKLVTSQRQISPLVNKKNADELSSEQQPPDVMNKMVPSIVDEPKHFYASNQFSNLIPMKALRRKLLIQKRYHSYSRKRNLSKWCNAIFYGPSMPEWMLLMHSDKSISTTAGVGSSSRQGESKKKSITNNSKTLSCKSVAQPKKTKNKAPRRKGGVPNTQPSKFGPTPSNNYTANVARSAAASYHAALAHAKAVSKPIPSSSTFTSTAHRIDKIKAALTQAKKNAIAESLARQQARDEQAAMRNAKTNASFNNDLLVMRKLPTAVNGTKIPAAGSAARTQFDYHGISRKTAATITTSGPINASQLKMPQVAKKDESLQDSLAAPPNGSNH